MQATSLPLLSIILPVFNEEALLRDHVTQICDYLSTLEHRYRWEVLIINDGSADNTGAVADQLAQQHQNVKVLHHPTNFGVGQALRFGFANSAGDYVITMDVDLSYDVRHIDEMVTMLQQEHAKIVLASPYMEGGSISNVPKLRKILSILGNRFLKFFSQGNLSTLTSMVRVYDGPFIRSMDFRSMGLELMPETLYKAMVVRAKIVEVPGRLDWGPQLEVGDSRQSSMKLVRQVISTVMSGFVFRPMYFFILPGVFLSFFAAYSSFWMFAHYLESVAALSSMTEAQRQAGAFSMAFANHTHTYVVGLVSVMLSIQLLGLGVLALQSKRNFEELYHLSATKFHSLKQTINSSP